MTNPAPKPSLPTLLVLTERTRCRRPLGDVIRGAVDGGATAVVLQETDLPRAERAQLAEELSAILEPVQGTLIIASDYTISATGVHLEFDEGVPDGIREGIVGRSCHNIEQLMQSFVEGVDYVTIGPIFDHAPGTDQGSEIGLTGLGRLARSIPLPMYAFGGVSTSNAKSCMFAGAAGLAVADPIMNSDRPDLMVGDLLAAFMLRS